MIGLTVGQQAHRMASHSRVNQIWRQLRLSIQCDNVRFGTYYVRLYGRALLLTPRPCTKQQLLPPLKNTSRTPSPSRLAKIEMTSSLKRIQTKFFATNNTQVLDYS